MSFVAAAVVAGGSVVAAGIGAYSANKAASGSLKQQNALFKQAQGNTQPFINAGKNALPTLSALLTPGPNQTATLNQLPGFQFAQDWGQKAVQNIGSTRGFGGNTLTAGANFATGLAQQGFGSYITMLQHLVDTGSGAASSAFGNATTTGANMGVTSAAGILGTGNALAGGFAGAGNATGNALLLNRLFPQNNPNANVLGNGIYSGDELATIGRQTADY